VARRFMRYSALVNHDASACEAFFPREALKALSSHSTPTAPARKRDRTFEAADRQTAADAVRTEVGRSWRGRSSNWSYGCKICNRKQRTAQATWRVRLRPRHHPSLLIPVEISTLPKRRVGHHQIICPVTHRDTNRKIGSPGLRAGYEDANDAHRLRHDPLLQIVADQKLGGALGSQPTLSRWENARSGRDLMRLNDTWPEQFIPLCDDQVRQR
jgi:hypothetical protein